MPEDPKYQLVHADSTFDYSSVSPSVATFLKGQADRIRRYAGSSIIRIGKDLIGAKHYLSHGAFIRWVETELGIPARTAQGYMRVAHWVGRKSATVAHLPPSVLYVLSARSTPTDFVSDVLQRVDAGEQITPRSIRGTLKALRLAKQGKLLDDSPARLTAPNSVAVTNGNGIVRKIKDASRVIELVRILVDRLDGKDLERVRNIMTSSEVLDDPLLRENIRAAFSIVDDERPNEHCKATPATFSADQLAAQA